MKLRDRQISKYFVGLALTGLFFLLFSPTFAGAQEQKYPRVANFYLKTPIWSDEANNLARFDVLILHMLAQQNSAEQIKQNSTDKSRYKDFSLHCLSRIPCRDA